MANKINPIKAIYRANFYKAKPIRSKVFPDGYFMKKSPLAAELSNGNPKWAECAAKLVDRLISVFK